MFSRIPSGRASVSEDFKGPRAFDWVSWGGGGKSLRYQRGRNNQLHYVGGFLIAINISKLRDPKTLF